MAVWDSHYYTLIYHCQHPSHPGCLLVWISVISCKPGYFTDSSSIGRVRQCTFLKISSDIHGLGDNEDLYATGSAVVGLYRLFTNFLKFWGIPRTGWIHWGGGGGGGGLSLGSQDLFPPILLFSHFFQLKLFEITKGDYT